MQFVAAVFPDQQYSDLLSIGYERTDEGIGPHFDVYHELIDPTVPWAGVYNLAGDATMQTSLLDKKLQTWYDNTYPDRTDEAGAARRPIGELAFIDTVTTNHVAVIEPGVGMIIPQVTGRQYDVHQVSPTGSGGKFVKIVKPVNKEAEAELRELGYNWLSERFEAYIKWGLEDIVAYDPSKVMENEGNSDSSTVPRKVVLEELELKPRSPGRRNRSLSDRQRRID